MGLEQAVKSTIERVQAVNGHVYTAEALRHDEHAFAFYRINSTQEMGVLGGFTGLYEADVEIHVVARSMQEVVTASGQLEAQAKAMQGSTVSGLRVEQIELQQRSPDIKEMLVGLYRRMYMVKIWYQVA